MRRGEDMWNSCRVWRLIEHVYEENYGLLLSSGLPLSLPMHHLLSLHLFCTLTLHYTYTAHLSLNQKQHHFVLLRSPVGGTPPPTLLRYRLAPGEHRLPASKTSRDRLLTHAYSRRGGLHLRTPRRHTHQYGALRHAGLRVLTALRIFSRKIFCTLLSTFCCRAS